MSTAAVRYISIAKFCDITGYTPKAVSRKREEGVWIEGKHYRRAPDGHILIDIVGYNEWVEKSEKSS